MSKDTGQRGANLIFGIKSLRSIKTREVDGNDLRTLRLDTRGKHHARQ
jgi:hypothetical protein